KSSQSLCLVQDPIRRELGGPTPTAPTSAVRNTAKRGKEIPQENLDGSASDAVLREYCDKHYNQLLPILVEKMHQEKLKAVKARLNFEEVSQHSESGTPSRRKDLRKRLGYKHVCSISESPEPRRDQSESPRKKGPERKTVFKRLEKGVFHRLGDKEKGAESAPKKNNSKREFSRRTEALFEGEDSAGGHWKSRSKRQESSVEEDDLSQPWVCEEIDPFIPRIRYFDFPKTRMPSHIKTYDGSEDPEDHLKIFQTATKMERWAMPTWCHMFNSTRTGYARVWFDDLPKESIDSYDDLKKAFLENYLQQKKCIKDPVEIHNIKQRDGESTEEFVRSKKLDRSKTSRREASGTNKYVERKQDRFTLLTKTPKEILALDKGKFKPPPPMTTLVEKRNASKFCEFHEELGHTTDECMRLKRQIEEMLKAEKLSHLIKELK
ncbi:reverse transcriptase domain-containing protein, partial [Tanacetum coccineum]